MCSLRMSELTCREVEIVGSLEALTPHKPSWPYTRCQVLDLKEEKNVAVATPLPQIILNLFWETFRKKVPENCKPTKRV